MSKSKYNGVKYETKPGMTPCWKVQLKVGRRVISVFQGKDEMQAAWVSDFCRYVTMGVEHRRWHGRAIKPNFPPCDNPDINRTVIIRRLLACHAVPPEILQRRLKEYDEVAHKLCHANK